MNRSCRNDFTKEFGNGSTEGRRIGIMGGTFNPIHNGHLLIAENAKEQYHLDKVYFIPTGPSPHKSDTMIAPAAIRCAMVHDAIADNPGFELSTIEVDSKERSYTYRTLEKLTEAHPNDSFYFIMGGDSVYYFDTWRKPERICELCSLLVAVRDSMDKEKLLTYANELERRFCAKVELLNTPNFSVSSREIRERVKLAESIRYLVPKEIENYIKEHQLYQAG